MVDKVKPLKIETATDGTEMNMLPTETDPATDYVSAKGVALENDDNTRVEKNVSGEVQFVDSDGTRSTKQLRTASENIYDNTNSGFTAVTVQDAIDEGDDFAKNDVVFTIVLTHNGTVSNNTFIGYSSLIPGDSTPIVIPKKSRLQGFAWSNSNSGADYTLELRKNGTGVTPFFSVSKVNTQFFVQNDINEDFETADEFYMKYIDNGTNASDATVLLFLNVRT